MPIHDNLGQRMKENYEQTSKYKLVRRMPAVIRLDGCHFHSFVRGFQKPFDDILIRSMQNTMKSLCENIEGCVLGYTQSDEITLILVDYKRFNSTAWFDNELQKMCSVSAAMCTMYFNKYFGGYVSKHIGFDIINPDSKYDDALRTAKRKGAYFDSRAFNIPKEEVANLIYWRQLDAMRNSVQMLGRAYFSHSELQNKSCNDIRNMLSEQKNIQYESLPVYLQRGSCCIKRDEGWFIDKEIPIFSGENRLYIESRIQPIEE